MLRKDDKYAEMSIMEEKNEYIKKNLLAGSKDNIHFEVTA